MIRVTDYIDKGGRLRATYVRLETPYGHAATANQRIKEIIGTRPVWSERYESIGGCRTWSEAQKAYNL